MELRHLRYFLAVAEHQGFRKAAQSLRVSNPSLCEQIIDLETEIGTRLFERTNHRVSLTAAGHTFVAGARKTLRCALQAVETAQKASREYRGELRIANVGLICPSILAQLISGFRKRYPKVEVSILQQNNFKWVEGAQRRAELGIGYLPAESASRPVGALRSSVIATAPVGIAVAATVKHDHQGPATIVDFAREPFLILDPKYAPGYLEWTRSIFLQTGFKPAKTILVDSAEALFTLIGAGVGVGLLSPLHFGAQSVGVSFRKLAESVADFPLSLVWNPERGGPLVNDFLTMARQILPKQEGILRLATHSRAVASQVLAERA
jgi:LysR family transcriptional regulator, benzoate and cis,cis-muconate-responsive activator of ben and cat genes